MSSSVFPYPPSELANYVGALASDEFEVPYEEIGREVRRAVVAMLPEDFELSGRAILDFGCGAGRVIRHFGSEAESGDVWGCDIDRPSIEWAERNISPPFHFLLSEELPSLPFPDERFDLIYAISVFTHLLDSWSAWLLEMHRLLRPGGILVTSFLGRGMTMAVADVPWDEDRIGMIPCKIAAPWSEGGPCVLHSPWWLRAHFGRAFEVVDLAVDGTAVKRAAARRLDGIAVQDGPINPPGDGGHGMIVLRKDGRSAPSLAELELPELGEAREFTALQFAVRVVSTEVETWRGLHDRAVERYRRAVEIYERAVGFYDRAVEQHHQAVEQHDRAVGFYDRAVAYARELEDELARGRDDAAVGDP